MKTLLITFACLLLCAGCGDGYNQAKCRQAVVIRYGHDVQPLPGETYRFIARATNGSVWFVECMGRSPDPTTEALLFGPSCQFQTSENQ